MEIQERRQCQYNFKLTLLDNQCLAIISHYASVCLIKSCLPVRADFQFSFYEQEECLDKNNCKSMDGVLQ